MEAQIGSGSIVGAVKDPAGAAVVGATVQAGNVETNAVGYYEFPLLPTSDTTNPNFGQILGASAGRNIQLALEYMF